jgi:hypothetical protein
MKNKRKIVYLKWIDSGLGLPNNWQEVQTNLEDVKERGNNPAESVGFLVKENKNWITLATSLDKNCMNGGCAVYKKALLERREIRLGK